MRKNQKIADKKKANYQETLQKNHVDSAERSSDSYMKNLEKSRADTAARSQENYEKNLGTLHEALHVFRNRGEAKVSKP